LPILGGGGILRSTWTVHGKSVAGSYLEKSMCYHSTISVIEINENLTAFYTGRDASQPRLTQAWNWHDDAAMKLGVATYAIHGGEEALIVDTFSFPSQAQWVRDYLEDKGIRTFTLVLSHWHLDHIGGNAAYSDSPIIASHGTLSLLSKHRSAIEAGELHGPPAIKPLVLPSVAYRASSTQRVNGMEVCLQNVNIHSADSTNIHIPSQGILLAGDTVEDSLTYMVMEEVANIAEHVKNLRAMRDMPVRAIYPNHGNPGVLARGGYDKTLIDATIQYITKMVASAHDPGFAHTGMREFIAEALDKGWIENFEPYEEVHEGNLKLLRDHFRNRPLPVF
jgi:cyclase